MNDVVLRAGYQPYISICAGAGGLDLGLRLALPGARCVCMLEHEVTAAEVLVARIGDGSLDDAPIWNDLHTFDGNPWRGRVSGLIGGYPCQPFSVAGKRLGTADPRHLWPSISRIIAECSPSWCFFENVAGHLRLGYFDVVRPDLESLGYRVTEGIFSASEVGAPHQRKRLFILAHRSGGGFGIDGGASWSAGHANERGAELAHAGHAERAGRDEGAVGGVRVARDVAAPRGGSMGDADLTRLEGRQRPQREGAYELPTWPPGPTEHERWAAVLAERPDLAPGLKPEVCGVADGLGAGPHEFDSLVRRVSREAMGAIASDLTRAQRLRIIGNGVCPPQAALAFRTLWERTGVT